MKQESFSLGKVKVLNDFEVVEHLDYALGWSHSVAPNENCVWLNKDRDPRYGIVLNELVKPAHEARFTTTITERAASLNMVVFPPSQFDGNGTLWLWKELNELGIVVDIQNEWDNFFLRIWSSNVELLGDPNLCCSSVEDIPRMFNRAALYALSTLQTQSHVLLHYAVRENIKTAQNSLRAFIEMQAERVREELLIPFCAKHGLSFCKEEYNYAPGYFFVRGLERIEANELYLEFEIDSAPLDEWLKLSIALDFRTSVGDLYSLMEEYQPDCSEE